MRALDTNVLVYALIANSPHHKVAGALLRALAEGERPWAIPWPCIYELLRIITHPRVYHPPMPLERARRDVAAILDAPDLMLLAETARHRAVLDEVLAQSGAAGNLVHDAHIAALCLEHGVSELITGDRDFLRFAGLKISNPFALAARQPRSR